MLIHLTVISKIIHQWFKKIYIIVPKGIFSKINFTLDFFSECLNDIWYLSQPVKCVEEHDKGSFPRIGGTDAETEVENASRFILITVSGRSVYIFECLCVYFLL